MSAVLVTGGSGSGKTTVAAALAGRGLLSLDADTDPELAGWTDPAGRPAEPDLDWLERHRWVWDLARLDRLLAAAAPRTLFVCGNAGNLTEAWDRFARVYLLSVDEPTMLSRLTEPSRDHDFGRLGAEREWLRGWVPRYEARMRALGAVEIDARRSLDHVVAVVLADCRT
jgi:hypothetical protein